MRDEICVEITALFAWDDISPRLSINNNTAAVLFGTLIESHTLLTATWFSHNSM